MTLKLLHKTLAFGGALARYKHYAESINSEVSIAVYQPPPKTRGKDAKFPVLFWLGHSDEKCTDFFLQSGVLPFLSSKGIIAVSHEIKAHKGVPYTGTGFEYATEELTNVIDSSFPTSNMNRAISGRLLGGLGVILAGLKGKSYQSFSAFNPFCHPTASDYCSSFQKLNSDQGLDNEKQWDPVLILESGIAKSHPYILIDQGLADPWLIDRQLHTEAFRDSYKKNGGSLTLRNRSGYDDSYFFVQTFILEHLKHHAAALMNS